MKNAIRNNILALTLVLTAGVYTPVYASGIPTVDLAAIAQAVMDAMQQATEAAAQLEQMTREVEQAKELYDENKELITGNSGYGSKYNSDDLTDYIPTTATSGSWEQIYSNMDASTLKAYRTKYGLVSDKPTQQEVYDKKLTNLRTLEGAHRANNLRLENIQNLQALADSAETPQEKQDVLARLSVEQASINNEANRLATVKDLMERQDQMLTQKQNTEYSKFLKGEE